MIKTLKLIGIVVTTYTVAEFVTMWRMQDQQIPLKKYFRTYIDGQKQVYKHFYDIGELLTESPREGAAAAKAGMFTKFYPEQ
jgi:hypothetical protein